MPDLKGGLFFNRQRARRTVPRTDPASIASVREVDFVRSIKTGNHFYPGCPGAEQLFKSEPASHDAYQAALTSLRLNVNWRQIFFRSRHFTLQLRGAIFYGICWFVNHCGTQSLTLSLISDYLNLGGLFSFRAEMPSFILSEIMVITWALASNSIAVVRSMVSPW